MQPTLAPAYPGKTRYSEAAADQYQLRDHGKNLAELALVQRAFAEIPRDRRVLDLPCGGGRVAAFLANLGYEVSAADYSDAMLVLCRKRFADLGLHGPVDKQDIERLSYPDLHTDAVICFRLFHHFPTRELRARVVSELCRIAKEYVVLSYFDPLSPTSLRRLLVEKLGGKTRKKFGTSLMEVRAYFQAHGFQLVSDHARLPWFHTLRLGVFRRVSSGQPFSGLPEPIHALV